MFSTSGSAQRRLLPGVALALAAALLTVPMTAQAATSDAHPEIVQCFTDFPPAGCSDITPGGSTRSTSRSRQAPPSSTSSASTPPSRSSTVARTGTSRRVPVPELLQLLGGARLHRERGTCRHQRRGPDPLAGRHIRLCRHPERRRELPAEPHDRRPDPEHLLRPGESLVHVVPSSARTSARSWSARARSTRTCAATVACSSSTAQRPRASSPSRPAPPAATPRPSPPRAPRSSAWSGRRWRWPRHRMARTSTYRTTTASPSSRARPAEPSNKRPALGAVVSPATAPAAAPTSVSPSVQPAAHWRSRTRPRCRRRASTSSCPATTAASRSPETRPRACSR